MATQRRTITVPADFFPPTHVRLGSRFSIDETIGRVASVQTVNRGASLRLAVEVEA